MSIYDPRRRFLLSCAVATGFAAAYLLFRVTTSPFLDVEREKQKFTRPQQAAGISPEARQDAEKWFVDHPWVATSGKYFRDSGRYLFCRTFELSDDKRSIKVRPLAMMWRAKDSDVPVRIVADSAELFGADEFSLNGGELGRVSGGILSGNVQVRGPDNLRIDGRTFHLEDAPMKLWSSEPIDFTFGRHTGRADSGVDVLFNEQSLESEGTDGINKVSLLGRVQCKLTLDDRRNGEGPTQLLVRAARGFVFENGVALKTGTFSGFPRTSDPRVTRNRKIRRLNRDQEVWVRRLSPDGTVDELVCPELRLRFRNDTAPSTGAQVADKIKLEHVQAWGRLVEFISPAQGVEVFANDFQYHVDARQIDIRYLTNDVTDQRKYVVVRRDESLLTVPHIRVIHTENNELQRLECNGPGGFRSVTKPESAAPDDKPRQIEGRWGESLIFQSAPDGSEQYLTLSGGGAFGDITRQLALSAGKITLTMASNPQRPTTNPLTTVGATSTDTPDIGDLFSDIRPRLLTASRNVVLKSPEADGTLRDSLTVRFLQQPSKTTARPIRTVSATNADKADNENTNSTERFSFTSDTGDAEVILSETMNADDAPPYRVWLNGSVDVERHSEKSDSAFTAKGNQLVAANSESDVRTIQLFGNPAKVESATRNLEGPRIDLNELSGQAEVIGSGRIRFVTTRGFDGKELVTPTPLDIYWSDHMEFRERSANFVGKVRVIMSDGETQDIEMLCAGLTVWFSADVSLNPSDESSFEAVVVSSTDEDQTSKSPVERLKCHHKVEVTIDQFVSGSLTGKHHAQFSDLEINLSTGNFNATGPGFLESISPDKEGQLQGSPPVVARPNTPSQTRETAFVYLRTEFVGEINGNIDRREATLSQNVVALMAPTRRVDEAVNLQQIPTRDLPERAGILQAEQLTFGAIPGRNGASDSFSLLGRTNARLESRSISASADVITYDHQKEQFIIRAEGSKTVNVSHRTGVGGQFNRTSGSRFEYYRQTNQLKADQIDRMNLSE